MKSTIKKHIPWAIFALVLTLSLGALDQHSLDNQAREASDDTQAKSAWIERQTQAMELSELGHLAQIQKVLQVTRGPSSIVELD